MRILIAPDKFKGTLSARAAAEQIAAGLRDALPGAELDLLPVADGGEGTAEVLAGALGARWLDCEIRNAFGERMAARYGFVRQTATAILEMSATTGRAGLTRRDPLRATTFGVGEMILHAGEAGAREIIIGLGGSVTNDGGLGMARALGYRFQSEAREIVSPNELLELDEIVPPAPLSLPKVVAAVDVQNPLLGERGATHVFGPQKGATPDQLALLERALSRLAEIATRDLGVNFRDEPGAGASGGLGFGLRTFAQAQLQRGFDLVAQTIGLEERMRSADVVITGEGKLDAQTLEGKAPAGVAQLARRLGKPVHALVGQVEPHAKAIALFDSVQPLAGTSLHDRACELGRWL